MRRFLGVAVGVGALLTLAAAQGGTRKPIEGVWRITMNEQTGDGAAKIPNPPSVLIFTAKYYSVMFVSSAEPRKPWAAAEPTQDEKNAALESFAANSGTYELNGNQLTLHPTVARHPGFMAGGYQKYVATVSGNTMTLANKTGDFYVRMGGKIVPDTGAASTTKLTLVRIE